MSSYQKSDIKMVPTSCFSENRTRVQMKTRAWFLSQELKIIAKKMGVHCESRVAFSISTPWNCCWRRGWQMLRGLEWLGPRVTVCVKLLVTRAIQSIGDPPMKWKQKKKKKGNPKQTTLGHAEKYLFPWLRTLNNSREADLWILKQIPQHGGGAWRCSACQAQSAMQP